jgi:AbrB family looped-hinge helix DNA binding protein
MARSVVAVNRQGRITLPVDVRRRLSITEGTQLEVKVESNTVQLRRASIIPDEDRWAYTPAAIASLTRALADVKAGRVFELSARDLESGKYPRRRRRAGRVR